MQVYAADAVHAALPWVPLAEALRVAFMALGEAAAQVPQRHVHALGGGDSLLLMPAWDTRLLVTKLVTVMPQADHTVQASVLAMERSTGRPLALLDGEALTLRRTAATSALAAGWMARPDATRLLLVGTGRLAPWMARAHAALRPGLEVVQVWGRDAGAARRVAGLLRAEGLPATDVADLPAAVQAAHIVCCATTATEPLVQGAWLRPGVHLDLVGAFRPEMREADTEAVRRARVVVDTLEGCLAEAGDLVQPIAAGAMAPDHVLGDLSTLLNGVVAGRRGADDITLFKSVGSARADLAAAAWLLQGLAADPQTPRSSPPSLSPPP